MSFHSFLPVPFFFWSPHTPRREPTPPILKIKAWHLSTTSISYSRSPPPPHDPTHPYDNINQTQSKVMKEIKVSEATSIEHRAKQRKKIKVYHLTHVT